MNSTEREMDDLLRALIARGAPEPRVYPTPSGGLQAEWTIGSREASVAIEQDDVFAISVDVSSGEVRDYQSSECDADAIAQVIL